MLSKVVTKMKNYNWLLILLLLAGIFLAMFCLALFFAFFLSVFGGPQFSWRNVLIGSSFLTVFILFIFALVSIAASGDAKEDEENDLWKK